jgi:hypothetical protein
MTEALVGNIEQFVGREGNGLISLRKARARNDVTLYLSKR